jgi:hypothetical protein
MERSWMYNLLLLDQSYRLEVHNKFIDVAKRHACREKMKHIYCPCVDHKDVFPEREQIISHMVCQGFIKGYMIWSKRGVGSSMSYAISNPCNIMHVMYTGLACARGRICKMMEGHHAWPHS